MDISWDIKWHFMMTRQDLSIIFVENYCLILKSPPSTKPILNKARVYGGIGGINDCLCDCQALTDIKKIHLIVGTLKLKQILNVLNYSLQIWLTFRCFMLIYLDLHLSLRCHHGKAFAFVFVIVL